jgi:hypothetical protein
MLEKDIEKKCLDYARSQGYSFKKLRIVNERGFPDRTLFGNEGEIAFVELKRGKSGRLSAPQKFWIQFLRDRGFEVWVPTTFEEFQNEMDGFMRRVRVKVEV